MDGSKTSLDAAEHAICHAEKHDSELTALYVVSSDVRYGYLEDDVIMGYTSSAKSIVEYAEERNMDLIVIGTRGMTGIKKMLLGSTATGVVTYAHCPVLIVK